MSLPSLIDRSAIRDRLKIIFPDGFPERANCTGEAAASTVFTMLYIGAIAGTDFWLKPAHVVRMSNRRAKRRDEKARSRYRDDPTALGKRWYEENTREHIRKAVLRQGLIAGNAVVERPGIPTNSEKPRYALVASFAALLNPESNDREFMRAAKAWATANLDPASRARIQLAQLLHHPSSNEVLVTFPNGEVRRMAAGQSSEIARSVIENFAPRFLHKAAVLLVSESRKKVVSQDSELAIRLGLKIDASKYLPDIILVDLGAGPSEFLIVFVEVVASDGPMRTRRVEALHAIASAARFGSDQVAFVTAYASRDRPEFKKTVQSLAWRSFAWFATEPENVMQLHDGTQSPVKLSDLVRQTSNRLARK